MTQRALVTGATGYIGGRLVPELLAAGYDVRCLARDPSRLRDRSWAKDVEIVKGDATDAAAVHAALSGAHVVYYLIHSMWSGSGFEGKDAQAAQTFADGCKAAGVERIVYLGGLADGKDGSALSPHLKSRADVGDILLASGVPTAVLQAAVIMGSGSVSFEMLRYLTERLPVMVTPKWVTTRIQPIAVRDVLHYLVGAATLPPEVSRRFDIGGPDVLTYQEMMQRYAAGSGLRKRIIVRVPVLTPWLSSHWVQVVTPVPNAIARPLVESLRTEVVCSEKDIENWVADPPGGLTGFDRAVALALKKVKDADVTTRWSNASLHGAPSDPLPSDPDWSGGSLHVDEREVPVTVDPARLWRVIEGIGGARGWYSFPLAWAVRGWLDVLVGGVGLTRGRRDPDRLQVGDTLDFWRVEDVLPGRMLRLRAEMRLPGLAWLELGVSTKNGSTLYTQRAIFQPRGLAGQAYWWAVWPFHRFVFGGMARNIIAAAKAG
ncbi:MAG: SDR family oxidoreductase [Mycobacteriales bacterium]